MDLRSTGVNSAWVRTPQLSHGVIAGCGSVVDIRAIGSAPHHNKMTPVGFEPTQLALVELESTPLDHSGKVSCLLVAWFEASGNAAVSSCGIKGKCARRESSPGHKHGRLV